MAGTLKDVSATELGVASSKAALEQAGMNPDQVDEVIFGNVCQSSPDAIYLARHIGLKCGVPKEAAALTVNRLCGSGFESIIQGAKQIMLGESKVVLAGGAENMSMCPHSIYGARQGSGLPLGGGKLVDSLWEGLIDSHTKTPMGVTAENLATQYNISQQEVDEFSVRSQQLLAEAQSEGRLDAELFKMEVKRGRKSVEFTKDEHGRPGATVESFAKLPRVFKKDGVVHPAAASGINDGAASVILTSEEHAAANGWTPLARLVAHGTAGCEPTIMGIGPVPAAHKAFAASGMSMADMGLVEVNEAFAPQALAVQKELGIPMEKYNLDGGAIAIGHPLGASGARITAHMVYAMKHRGVKHALGSACIGGGQGIALILESI
eukprot:TRINITY_DN65149_c0_g1_i1.p2 TRINITY_DN65149_c0_g1~~TRINITY_DN65149_c0_g1_i1.p2  ORF type:complete len:418 (+),score=160.04 TRINITY_DN65149_c0_g1_i1:120-1256(+)